MIHSKKMYSKEYFETQAAKMAKETGINKITILNQGSMDKVK